MVRGPAAASVLGRAGDVSIGSEIPLCRPRAPMFRPSRPMIKQGKDSSKSFSYPRTSSSQAIDEFAEREQGEGFKASWPGSTKVMKICSTTFWDFVRSKIPNEAEDTIVESLVKKLVTDALESGWNKLVQVPGKLLHAAFWAGTGVLFCLVEYASDGTIKLHLKMNDSEEKEKKATENLVKIFKDECSSMSAQQAKSTSHELTQVIREEVNKGSKKQEEAWNDLKKELMEFKLMTQGTLVKLIFPERLNVSLSGDRGSQATSRVFSTASCSGRAG